MPILPGQMLVVTCNCCIMHENVDIGYRVLQKKCRRVCEETEGDTFAGTPYSWAVLSIGHNKQGEIEMDIVHIDNLLALHSVIYKQSVYQ